MYPKKFQDTFQKEMLDTFEDYYQNTLKEKGKVDVIFWKQVLLDEVWGAIQENINNFNKIWEI